MERDMGEALGRRVASLGTPLGPRTKWNTFSQVTKDVSDRRLAIRVVIAGRIGSRPSEIKPSKMDFLLLGYRNGRVTARHCRRQAL